MSADYCACTDCESVLSPAAYLVDLLHNFLDTVPANALYSVLGVLTSRRPDLRFVRLDCANAELLIPYIDIVNEILEACVVYGITLPHQVNPPYLPLPNDTSSGATADELAANPENIHPEAYEVLRKAVYPPALPFNLSWTTMRADLAALGTSRRELMGTFSVADGAALACEALGFTDEEHVLVSAADTAGNPFATPYPVDAVYGGVGAFSGLALYTVLKPVETFLRFAGLEFADLLALLKTRYVNPAGTPPVQRVHVMTKQPCSLEGAEMVNLASDTLLGRIHRFLRLWRKRGGSLFELDRCLHAFHATEIDDPLLIRLADAQALSSRLNVPVPELLPLWAPLDTYRYDETPSPYHALFLRKTVTQPLNGCFALNGQPAAPEIAGEAGCTMTISAHLTSIQGALRLRAGDLAALAAAVLPDDQLNLANLSALHRHAVLARALRCPVDDLLSLRTLHGTDPFQSPAMTMEFVEFAETVRDSGFSVAQLNFLYRDLGPAPGAHAWAPWVATLQEELARIEREHAPAYDPNGEFTRGMLAALYDAATTEQIVGLILGVAVWRVSVYPMPSLAVDDELKQKLSYLPASKTLQFTGVMSDGERDTLSAGQPPAFQAAIQHMWQQPRTFIDGMLTTFPRIVTDAAPVPFLDAAQAKAKLLDSVASPAEKFAYVQQPLLGYLRDMATRDAATQTLMRMSKADPTLVRWMLDTGLRSCADPAQPAMAQFVAARGVDALYFPGTALTGQAVVTAEADIAFDWGAGSPDPAIPHAGFSAQWTALLAAPETLSYTLHVQANDGVRLWLDGRLLIDDWNSQPLGERTAEVELKAGRLYAMTLQYFQATAAQPSVHLLWSTAVMPKTAVPASALHPLDHWRRFHKAILLIAGLQLGAADIGYLVAHGGQFDGLDLNRLPLHPSNANPAVFATWRRLQAVRQLRNRLALPDGGLARLFGAPSRSVALALLAELTGWNEGEVSWLAGPSGLNLADAELQTEVLLLSLAACMALAARTGASVQQLGRWAGADMADAAAPAVAAEVRKALKARYGDAAWLPAAKALNDPLRQARRDALVNYLLAHPERVHYADTNPLKPTLKTADDLYEYLLIDVQMAPCMRTARIPQALCSIQLFVQRCLLGMEADVPATALSERHWAWMKNYRVWEAARRVFMWPENWAEVRLRDDKSIFFQELETDLLKSELNKINVEAAFTSFLHKLEAIARPDIVGLYVEEPGSVLPGEPARRTHVVGRTRSTPHEYFYRSQVERMRWTAWERIPATIDGDSVLPVVWERRLYLFWPVLVQKADPEQPPPGEAARKYWEIRFAYLQYQQGQWTPRRMLDCAVALKLKLGVDLAGDRLDAGDFSFKAIAADTALVLQVLVEVQIDPILTPTGAEYVREVVATVDVSVCDGETRVRYAANAFAAVPVQLPGDYPVDRTAPPGRLVVPASTSWGPLDLRPDAWAWQAQGGNLQVTYGFWDEYGDDPDPQAPVTDSEPVLGYIPFGFEVVVPHQYRQFDQQAEFFFQDSAHTYYVIPFKQRTPTPLGDYYALDVRFFAHYHPGICRFLTELHRHGVDGLLSLGMQGSAEWAPGAEFAAYNPAPAVLQPYPQAQVEFNADAAYACYNWELFFHAPLLVADMLHHDQRFAEADRWFRYIFNPVARIEGADPQRCWNFAPFYQNDPADPQNGTIQQLLLALDDQANPALADSVRYQLQAWANDPFNPHLVARLRPVAYQNLVLMKYIDNLVEWADQMFRRDSFESVNEATQLYLLAARVLGRKPHRLAPMVKAPPQTFAELGIIDEFSNALEDAVPLGLSGDAASPVANAAAGTLGVNLLPYFCVPPNPDLLAYWDTIADRLYKVRHCMNIEGTVRQPALYEPRIDPALLVRASAAGLDISAVLSDLHAPMPCYRFNAMLPKAQELCGALKSLGSALLSALEKQDAEALAVMRSGHESALLQLVRQVRHNQLREAQYVRAGLDKTWEVTEARRQYFETQLQENGSGLSGHEQEQQRQLDEAQDWQAAAQVAEAVAATSHLIADFALGTAGMASPYIVAKWGGKNLGNAAHATASILSYVSSVHTFWANEAGMQAGWERRARDWTLQMQTASKELQQIDLQRLAADIRIDIASQEITNHDRQIDNAREIEAFYRDKYTSRELYDWMVSELSSLYFRTYQTAFDVAKRCERAHRFELGLTESDCIKFGLWENMRKGLLAGERLELALRQMEQAYLERNRRDYEITKHISLRQLNPLALIALKQAGECEFEIPEACFDADYPGHYMRRIKSVSLSLPCIAGPYTSINATLTLLRNKVRVKNTPATPYEEVADSDDTRFVTDFAAVQSIATSHGQGDSGLFELNFRDERYLPFEGAGAISCWQLELQRATNAFDVNTVDDVIIQLKYTACAGGKPLCEAAGGARASAQRDSAHPALMQMISARKDFPDAWHRFFRPDDPDADAQVLALAINEAHFPYRSGAPLREIAMARFFLIFREPQQGVKQYGLGGPLKLSVTAGGTVWPQFGLASDPGQMKGTPQQHVELAAPLPVAGRWEIKVTEQEVKQMAPALTEAVPASPGGRTRLRMDCIDDLVVVLHYTVN